MVLHHLAIGLLMINSKVELEMLPSSTNSNSHK
jgi:hypothetical protein